MWVPHGFCRPHIHGSIDGKLLMALFLAENGASLGLSSGIVEADAKQIAKMARQTFDKYVY